MWYMLRVMTLCLGVLLLAACAPQAANAPTAAPLATAEAAAETLRVSGKAQFLDSYATWCTTCRRNAPLISTLKQQFADHIDVVTLDVDDPATRPLRDKFGLIDRSMYALVAPDGETVLARWFGVLDEQEVTARLTQFVQNGQ